jgi:hypothetical protein
MSITESLKAQLKTLEAQRHEHEKAANAIRRNEVKIRKPFLLCHLCPLSLSREPASIRFEVNGEWTRVHSPFIWGPSLSGGREVRLLLLPIREEYGRLDSQA